MDEHASPEDDFTQGQLDELDRACGPGAALMSVGFAQGPRDLKCGHTHEDFAKLVQTFSTMQDVPDHVLRPRFSPDALSAWVGELEAEGRGYDKRTITASFLCHAFNGLVLPHIPPFDLKDAIERWAPQDYHAFLRWAIRPWRG